MDMQNRRDALKIGAGFLAGLFLPRSSRADLTVEKKNSIDYIKERFIGLVYVNKNPGGVNFDTSSVPDGIQDYYPRIDKGDAVYLPATYACGEVDELAAYIAQDMKDATKEKLSQGGSVSGDFRVQIKILRYMNGSEKHPAVENFIVEAKDLKEFSDPGVFSKALFDLMDRLVVLEDDTIGREGLRLGPEPKRLWNKKMVRNRECSLS